MPDAPLDRSYRALLGVPRLGRVVASMGLARLGQSMVGVALVLFALGVYDSPALAGVVTFASVVPGLLIAPIAGALLDRHGRVREILSDNPGASAASHSSFSVLLSNQVQQIARS